jgi:hypothetical protein
MPNIGEESQQRQANSIFDEKLIIKGLLQYSQRFDRFLNTDLNQMAYRLDRSIATDKLSDNGKKEIYTTGRHPWRHHSLQYRLHQSEHYKRHNGLQLRQHQSIQQSQTTSLQPEPQHRLHQSEHFERHHGLQRAEHKDRQLGYIFINEIIYLPLA